MSLDQERTQKSGRSVFYVRKAGRYYSRNTAKSQVLRFQQLAWLVYYSTHTACRDMRSAYPYGINKCPCPSCPSSRRCVQHASLKMVVASKPATPLAILAVTVTQVRRATGDPKPQNRKPTPGREQGITPKGTEPMPKTKTTETPTTVETAENIRVEACTRTLKVVLSDREVLDRSADLTNTMDELANIEQEFASAKEQFKARVSEATAKVQRLKCEVRDRFVHVPVACDRIFNYAAGQVRIRHNDTYEEVDCRPMTEDERQGCLAL